MRIAAVGSAFPAHYVDQETLIAAFREAWGARYHNVARIEELHRNVLVGGRYLALPMEAYARLGSFAEANDAWIRVGLDVGAAAIEDALTRAGLGVRDVDALWCTSTTGMATPSLDARIINRLGFRADIKRVPIFGLGCVAGAAGIARAADYLKGHPDGVAMLLSVELCSLTLQRDDLSIPNLIASGLFGDGAAAVVLTGAARDGAAHDESARGDTARDAAAGGGSGAAATGPAARGTAARGPAIVATQSAFYPNTEEIMGWRIGGGGFQIILSAEVPEMVRRHLRGDIDAFLAQQRLTYDDIKVWVAHPGGPRVLQAMEEVLPMQPGALAITWKNLKEVGNLSSTSVLLVLRETMERAAPPPGSYGLMTAMGPGFCSELVLLQW